TVETPKRRTCSGRRGSTVKANPDALLVVHLYSPDQSRDNLYISNYARLQMRDRLQRLDGVGQIQAFGFREYAMRIWIDPDRAAALDLTGADIVRTLRAQNVEASGGVLDAPPNDDQGAFEVSLRTQGRLNTPEQFEQIVLKTGDNGRQVRLADVARIELGARDYTTNAQLNESPALAMLFNAQPGANALETAERILTTVEEMSADFPEGLEYDVIWNPTEFISESIHEVEKTILEAVLLVSLVVFLFLKSLRAAIIPIIAIPISLIGTFAAMAALGFSINMLTLFGLVLAIGIVVDDAIIVVENVERRIHDGLSPRDAARATMDDVGGALISMGLVLTAVFLPTAALPGISGEFYRQFAVTIAVATIISVAVSLTLSPALSAMLLKAEAPNKPVKAWQKPGRAFFVAFDHGFDALTRGYSTLVRRLIRISALVLVLYAGLLGLTAQQLSSAPKGFIPQVDQNYVITVVQLPSGASLARTDDVMNAVIRDGLAVDGVENAAAFAGLNGATLTTASNSAAVFFTMEDIKKRGKEGRDVNVIIDELRNTFASRQDAFILVVPPPSVRGVGNAGGFKGYVQDRSDMGYEALAAEVRALSERANGEDAVTAAFSIFETETPQLFTNIDREKAQQLGINMSDLFATLEVYLGSAYVNDFTAFGRSSRVTAQADQDFRRDASNVADLRTRNIDGNMVPVGTVATFEDVTGPSRVARYNLFPAAQIQGDVTPGFSSGQALDSVETAVEDMNPGFSFEWTELALQERSTGNVATIAFGLAVLFVFLLLAAQYESFSLPLAVILIVPMTLLSSTFGVLARGLDINILVQVGFVVLIGLAAKNAILIVEFAKQASDRGATPVDAALEAARLRLRPIVMTSMAFILGVIPLMIGQGAGFEMRQSLGTAVFFGMLGVTLFGLAFTPVFYAVIGQIGERLRRKPAPQTITAQ
ncbi:MAG: efflux RND transporter permease subunit, partial [Pseudomonadota bacterium]